MRTDLHSCRVSLMPRKVTNSARIPVISKLVFALPGNPASAFMTLLFLGGWPKKKMHTANDSGARFWPLHG